MTKAEYYRQVFNPNEFPELYSKRGFERKRIRIIMPDNRNELASTQMRDKILNTTIKAGYFKI
jgi:hypothetical protein